LVELVVVVFILGLAAAVGGPALNSSLDSARVSSAADEVVAALEFARMTASSGGRPCRVSFDPAADTLAVQQLRSSVDLTDPALTEVLRVAAETVAYGAVWHPLRKGKRYHIDFGNAVGFGDVNISSATFGGGSSVIFATSGSPSSAGTVVLERNGRSVVVTLDELTGKVAKSG
jgi:Tfp pilus assembly protein FimT